MVKITITFNLTNFLPKIIIAIGCDPNIHFSGKLIEHMATGSELHPFFLRVLP
ncbi:hypothetical protein LS482_12520 [Sinomicrobium kalidii]|uniref:hypothetical protein n=1 Tax=Sinomicrobium kalidii TaxID=2900738 RepID=UPI001E3BB002|nr:hypothetical protein [Sinomicrobium kalidii]UGU14519.1 hypothetical protein LS482_12520 [Sinomicrobium kalidii]